MHKETAHKPGEPGTIARIHAILGRESRKQRAPIAEFTRASTKSPFCILVATILSARTQDRTTAAACERLFRVVREPHDFDRLTTGEVEALIRPVGFFHTKARHLRQLPAALDRESNGRIPETLEGLCRLPGVGRKTANLVLAVAFNQAAICVDVHVHRIGNRLGLVRTRNPFETELALRAVLPVRYWKTWNARLVSFGQTTCLPLNPRCDRCPIYRYCSRVGVVTRHPRTPVAISSAYA